MKTITQKYRAMPVKEMKPHPKNPRQGDVGAIHQSIEQNGWYGAVVVQKSTGYVLAGNHRLQAAIAQGADKLPAMVVDVDNETATKILLADNRTNDLAAYDVEGLAGLLEGLTDFDGTGYDGDDLDDLLASLQEVVHEENNVRRHPSLSEYGERYEASATRSVVLDYSLDDFKQVTNDLATLRERLGAANNSDVVKTLVDTAIKKKK